MKKKIVSAIAVGTLALGMTVNDAEASTHQVQPGDNLWDIANTNNISVANLMSWNNLASTIIYPNQVLFTNTDGSASQTNAQASSSSEVKSAEGTYTTLFNSNIRMDVGTQSTIVMIARKGTTATVTGEKDYNGQTWFAVNINGTSGWILSTLLTNGAVVAPKPTTTVTTTTTAKTSAPAAPAPAITSNTSGVVNVAMGLRGIPYQFGGTTVSGFDCSGFVQYVYKQSGIYVSRSTESQYAQSKQVSSPVPGDLVFFQNTYKKGISHVGIYIGNNQFVHAGGKSSEVKSLNDVYWKTKFHSFKRF